MALQNAVELQAPDTTISTERQLDPEEEFLVDDPETLPADVEAVVDGEEPPVWRATHYIGDTPVQQRTWANGLPYWVTEDGHRRRPTKTCPLRLYAPKAEARQMWLDRDAFCLCCAALSDAVEGRAENGWTIAERIDDAHVRLSLLDKDNTYRRYIIQLPEEFEVAGTIVD